MPEIAAGKRRHFFSDDTLSRVKNMANLFQPLLGQIGGKHLVQGLADSIDSAHAVTSIEFF